ncbi:MAG TPA: hypothetical protein VFK02_11490 [Kofleriaceae bacterium]|nr:hypothetical protein [Kofleriaceae bacterium]
MSRPPGAVAGSGVPGARTGVAALAALVGAVAACSSGPSRQATTHQDPVPSDDEATRLAHLLGELQDDVLTSYERDEPPDVDSGMIDPRIGTARIGVRPGDLYIAGDIKKTGSRWPLEVDRTMRTEVRSKRLDLQLSGDQTAAWMSDEVSWRIEMCDEGRTAVIPFRVTALYAHDGDRWVPVVEHLSFGWTPTPAPADAPPPRSIRSEVVSGDLKDELSGVVGRGLFRVPHDPDVVAQDASALALGPDAADEWRGAHVLDARLPGGKLEDRRVGTVGRTPGEATVAYWIGTYVADVPARPGVAAGKVRMRVSYVFEKRRRPADGGAAGPVGGRRSCAVRGGARPPADCRWVLVQSHMSQPITEDELTRQVFGTALISMRPLSFDCSDRARSTVPGAAPRRGSPPAAARTP